MIVNDSSSISGCMITIHQPEIRSFQDDAALALPILACSHHFPLLISGCNVVKTTINNPQSSPYFYRWYKLTIPSHGWFMALFYPH